MKVSVQFHVSAALLPANGHLTHRTREWMDSRVDLENVKTKYLPLQGIEV
jgi:hypothetical protein